MTVYGGGHYYAYARLVKPLALSSVAMRWTQAGMVCLLLSFPFAHFLMHRHLTGPLRLFYLVSAVWMGLVAYMFLGCLVLDLGRLVTWIAGRPGRISTGPITSMIVAGIAALFVGYGLVEAHHIRIRKLRLPVARLPVQATGMRIAHLSDLHLGAIHHLGWLQNIVERTETMDPDLVLITGDLFDGQAEGLREFEPLLNRLGKQGNCYAVLGNHEFFAGPEKATEVMQQCGIHVLRNRWVPLENGIQLAGMDDPAGSRIAREPLACLPTVLHGINTDLPIVLMYHTPATTFEELLAAGVDLQLSGHTHGGQLWPANFIVGMIFDMPAGLFRAGDTHVYVSRGTGTWGPPVRVASPPEIALIELVPGID